MTQAAIIDQLLGDDLPVRFEGSDGSSTGPDGAATTVRITSPDALNRILWRPGELGFARAYVAGDLVVDGELDGVFDLRDRLGAVSMSPAEAVRLARSLGPSALRRLPPPAIEVVPRGRAHSLRRDKAAVQAHYDVSNEFYALFLDPSMTYSCAVFEQAHWTLAEAQAAKHELVLRKLALRPGMRLLEIGCGWGAHLIHAARHFDVTAVGITISHEQAELARKRVAEAGLEDRIEIREQDYREVPDGPYDAISSIGMFEHVGRARTAEFVDQMYSLLRPGGRALLHSITHPYGAPSRRQPASFINRYIFPDGELQRLGEMVDAVQHGGFEVLNVDALNRNYATTLQHWVANLEARWDEAVAMVGIERVRAWRLYLAGTAHGFRTGNLQVQQLACGKPHESGRSAFAARPDWSAHQLDRHGG